MPRTIRQQFYHEARPNSSQTIRHLDNQIAKMRRSYGLNHIGRGPKALGTGSRSAKGLARRASSRNLKVGAAIGVGALAIGVGVYAYKRHKRTVISRSNQAKVRTQARQTRTRHRRTFYARDSQGHFK